MKFTEHAIGSSMGTLKLQGTDSGHIIAKFGFLAGSFSRTEADALYRSLRMIMEQIDQAVIEQLERAQ